jgi:hypothetical protein
MKWYDCVGWIGTLVVLACYAWARQRFDVANMLLWPAVILPSVYRRAWSAAAISFAFGIIGTYYVLT